MTTIDISADRSTRSVPKAQQAQTTSSVSRTRLDETRLTWLQSMARRKLLQHLNGLTTGTIKFSDSRGQQRFGHDQHDVLNTEMTVNDPRLYGLMAADGSLGFAESYLRGHWDTNDLTGFLRLLYRNMGTVQSTGVTVVNRIQRFAEWFNRNTRRGSRRNIAAHYDLSNQFFELFLDPTLMYSSAWFEDEQTSLHAASIAKLDRICRKLNLQSDDHVMEIGTGWGGFALHAVRNYSCSVTTTTISHAQFERAQQRFADAGVSDRVQLLESDYRDLHGQYDKLVSIEMVEAVGEQFLDGYFRRCGRLLRPGGKFAMQAIVMPESRYGVYRRRTDFIQKYIFPGGFLPSVAALQASAGRTTNLRIDTLEDMSMHYARTLQLWRERFFDRLDDVRELGFDDRFIRMWEYYLCYCEAAFREQAVRVVQIVWDQPPC